MRAHVLTSVIAIVASACTFSIKLEHTVDDAAIDDARPDSPMMTIDAPLIDAAPPIDAGPDAMPMWVQIDMFNVSCLGTEVLSTVTLLASTTYRLRASGDCIVNDQSAVGGDVHGDAEYIWNSLGTEDESGGVDMGIAVNDTTLDMEKLPRWGSFTNSHNYTQMWMGLGAAIVVKYHDPNYTNNSGQLQLAIDAFQ